MKPADVDTSFIDGDAPDHFMLDADLDAVRATVAHDAELDKPEVWDEVGYWYEMYQELMALPFWEDAETNKLMATALATATALGVNLLGQQPDFLHFHDMWVKPMEQPLWADPKPVTDDQLLEQGTPQEAAEGAVASGGGPLEQQEWQVLSDSLSNQGLIDEADFAQQVALEMARLLGMSVA